MTARKLTWPLVCFVLGLGIGVLWSPLSGAQGMHGRRAISDAQLNKYVAELRQKVGEEAAQFEEQFRDMTVRMNEYPLRVSASPDGRFVINAVGNGESIASDLFAPDKGGAINELVRHYSFSCDKQTYSCDFGRSIKDSKMTDVQFHFMDAKGGELVYVDFDGDGRWDRLTDLTQTPPQSYVRRGLCWESVTKDSREK